MEMVVLDKETRLAIKMELLRRGMHQYELGQAVGINENRLSAVLCGRRSIPAQKVDELHAFLGMEPVDVSS
jgi:transcriptional regulator with XRE-family HTH domain